MRSWRLLATMLAPSAFGLLIFAAVGCDKFDVRFTKAGSSFQQSDQAQSTASADATQSQPVTANSTPQPNYGTNGAEPSSAKAPPHSVPPYDGAAPYETAPSPSANEFEVSSPPVNVSPSTPNAPTYFAPPVTSTPTTAPEVRLRTGVALPQSLPTGTAMGFSVDYEFVGGPPRPSSAYVWVLVRGDGARAEIPAAVMNRSAEGTLQTFITTWRPDDGPFKCHIEERTSTNTRRAISNSIDLL